MIITHRERDHHLFIASIDTHSDELYIPIDRRRDKGETMNKTVSTGEVNPLSEQKKNKRNETETNEKNLNCVIQ